jgi:hypothetical protein
MNLGHTTSRILRLCYNTRGNRNGKQQSRNNSILADSTSIERCTIVFRLHQFHSRFINGFSRICCPLTESTKGDKKSWKWTLEMNKAFDELKKRFINAPILKHYDPNSQCILETDASDFALGAILSQRSDNNAFTPNRIPLSKIYTNGN